MPAADETRSRLDAVVLYGALVITGAAIMVLEVVGTRIIGPFYGVGLVVWCSLISVTLTSLALGYWLGGLIADRSASSRLHQIVLLAAVLIALISVARPAVLSMTSPLGLRGGALASAGILFSGPLVLLAMAGPYVIRLRASRLDLVGLTAGSAYAISTVGSIAGTLLSGLVLIPVVGTGNTLRGLSVGLLVLGGVLLLYERRRPDDRRYRQAATALVLGMAAAGALTPRAAEPADPRFDVLHDSESFYGRIRVVDERQQGIRWLLSDFSAIGVVEVRGHGQFLPFLPFVYVLDTLPQFHPVRRALVIGVGAGLLPNRLSAQGIAVDVIEIDPEVRRMAETYFGFVPSGTVLIGDARYWIRKLERRYDLIVHDCFTGGELPSHLFSVEVIRELESQLEKGGVFAMNVYGKPDGAAVTSIGATLRSVFPFVARIVPPMVGGPLLDNLFIASLRPLSAEGTGALESRSSYVHWTANQLAAVAATPPAAGGSLITDDHNPLDLLRVPEVETYRKIAISRFGTSFLAR
ncbi:MAG: hypothetical protein QOD06_2724 [Candidatus Binatota bacterium]|jgi:predicted membrane-bound spermidine synthase|nr:hypothetical protein [Candidatus Binatota bacterium]